MFQWPQSFVHSKKEEEVAGVGSMVKSTEDSGGVSEPSVTLVPGNVASSSGLHASKTVIHVTPPLPTPPKELGVVGLIPALWGRGC